MKIALPHPHVSLSPNNGRQGWQSVSHHRKKARELARLTTEEVHKLATIINPDEPLRYTTYEIWWNYYGTQLPDDDNIIARCKSYKDGICDALEMDDRNLQCAGVHFYRDKATKKTLHIVLTDNVLLNLTRTAASETVKALHRLAALDTSMNYYSEINNASLLADIIEQQIVKKHV